MAFIIVICLSIFSYLQSNGYKPLPLDLSSVKLTDKLKDLVHLLAENTHNIWAHDRIKNGWSYGPTEVLFIYYSLLELVCITFFALVS